MGNWRESAKQSLKNIGYVAPTAEERKQKRQEERREKVLASSPVFERYNIDPDDFSFEDLASWGAEHNQQVKVNSATMETYLAPKYSGGFLGVGAKKLSTEQEDEDAEVLTALAKNNFRKKSAVTDYGKTFSAVEGFADGLTFGAAGRLADKKSELEYQKAGLAMDGFVPQSQSFEKTVKEHPKARALGSVAGSTASLMALGGVVGEATSGVKWLAKASPWVKNAVDSGITFAISKGTNTAFDGGNAEEVIKNAGIGLVGGAVGGGLSGKVGSVGETILFNKQLQNKVIPEMVRSGLSGLTFAAGDTASTYFLYPEGSRPTAKQMAQDFASAFAFAALSSGWHALETSKESRAVLEQLSQKAAADYKRMVQANIVSAENNAVTVNATNLAENVLQYTEAMKSYLTGKGFKIKVIKYSDQTAVEPYRNGAKGTSLPTETLTSGEGARFVGQDKYVKSMLGEIETIQNNARAILEEGNVTVSNSGSSSAVSNMGNIKTLSVATETAVPKTAAVPDASVTTVPKKSAVTAESTEPMSGKKAVSAELAELMESEPLVTYAPKNAGEQTKKLERILIAQGADDASRREIVEAASRVEDAVSGTETARSVFHAVDNMTSSAVQATKEYVGQAPNYWTLYGENMKAMATGNVMQNQELVDAYTASYTEAWKQGDPKTYQEVLVSVDGKDLSGNLAQSITQGTIPKEVKDAGKYQLTVSRIKKIVRSVDEKVAEQRTNRMKFVAENDGYDAIGVESGAEGKAVAKTQEDWKQIEDAEVMPENIMIIRRGDFYEAFGDEAIKLANKLNLIPIYKTIDGVEHVMVEFPVHMMEQYQNRLGNAYQLMMLDDTDATVTNDKRNHGRENRTMYEIMDDLRLTYEEQRAILEYKSSGSYKINDKLRRGEALSEAETKLKNDMNRALDKFPNFRGKAYREIGFDGKDGERKFAEFIREHTGKSKITYSDFTSALKTKENYITKADFYVNYEILCENAKDVAKIGLLAENEVLFPSDTKFSILDIAVNQNVVNIKIKELRNDGTQEDNRTVQNKGNGQIAEGGSPETRVNGIYEKIHTEDDIFRGRGTADDSVSSGKSGGVGRRNGSGIDTNRGRNEGKNRDFSFSAGVADRVSPAELLRLTYEEENAVLEYKSSGSYKINDKLRRGEALSEAETKLKNDMNRALDKFPNFRGKAYREIGFENKESFKNFADDIVPEMTFEAKAFMSASKSADGYITEKEYKACYEIESYTCKDVSQIGLMSENEVLFKQGTRIVVNAVDICEDKIKIVCEELNEDGKKLRTFDGEIGNKARGVKHDRQQSDFETGNRNGVEVDRVRERGGEIYGLSESKSESNRGRSHRRSISDSMELCKGNRDVTGTQGVLEHDDVNITEVPGSIQSNLTIPNTKEELFNVVLKRNERQHSLESSEKQNRPERKTGRDDDGRGTDGVLRDDTQSNAVSGTSDGIQPNERPGAETGVGTDNQRTGEGNQQGGRYLTESEIKKADSVTEPSDWDAKTEYTHLYDEKKVSKKYLDAVNPEIEQAIRNIRNGNIKAVPDVIEVTELTGETIKKISDFVGFDVSGYVCKIEKDALQHIENRHGMNGSHDHSLSDPKDTARMGYIVNNSDSVGWIREKDGTIKTSKKYKDSHNKPANLIMVQKKIDGTYCVSDVIPDSKNKTIWITSIRIQKKHQDLDDNVSPKTTPKNALNASNNIVSQDNDTVNAGVRIAPETERITVGMSDDARAELLNKKSVNVVSVDAEKVKALGDIDIDALQNGYPSYARPIIKKIARDFGVLNEVFFNADIELDFRYSGDSVRESINKQHARYGDFARMLSVFPDIVENAVGIETHKDKYAGTRREDTNLKQMYVLMSAFRDGKGIYPVKLEVKEFKKNANKLYLSVVLTKKESRYLSGNLGQNQLNTAPPTSATSIADLVGIVNSSEGDFLKYFPDSMLDSEQIRGKYHALKKETARIEKVAVGSQVPYGSFSTPRRQTPGTTLNSSSASETIVAENNDTVNAAEDERITVNTGDDARAKLLSKKSVRVVSVDAEKVKALGDIDIDALQNGYPSYARPIIKKIARDFGVLNEVFFNADIELDFRYSGDSVRESINKQHARYGDFARMLSVFPDIVENAVGIETHKDKYIGTRRADTTLKQMYVLVSAFSDETGIIPVKLEVKEFHDKANKLYLSVVLTKKESRYPHGNLGQSQLNTATPASAISIADLVGIVNSSEGDFLKYFPDSMLDSGQIRGKYHALKKETEKVEKLADERGTDGSGRRDAENSGTEDLSLSLDNLAYVNKTKSQQWSTSRGLRLPTLVQSITDNDSILQKEDIVNGYDRNNGKKYSSESEEFINEQAGNGLLSGNSGRTVDAGSGEQTKRVSNYKQRLCGQAEAVRKRTAKELTVKGYTEEIVDGNHKYTLIREDGYNDDMRAIVSEAKAYGKEVGFFIGHAVRKFDGQRTFKIDGIRGSGNKILIRYDGVYAPQTLLMHEWVHTEWENPEMQKAKEIILADLSEGEKERILQNGRYKEYMELYNGDEDAVWQEFVADVFAGMNRYSDDYIDTAVNYWYNDKVIDRYNPAEYIKLIDAGGNEAVLDNIGFGNEYRLSEGGEEYEYGQNNNSQELGQLRDSSEVKRLNRVGEVGYSQSQEQNTPHTKNVHRSGVSAETITSSGLTAEQAMLKEQNKFEKMSTEFYVKATENGVEQSDLFVTENTVYYPNAVFERNDISVKNGVASFTEKRFDDLMEEFSVSVGGQLNRDYAKAYVAYISPSDFLSLTTNNEKAIIEQTKTIPTKYGNGKLDVKQLAATRQTPYLVIDFEDGVVCGHEGRHRMVMLRDAGIGKVAIVIENINPEADKYHTKKMQNVLVSGQVLNDKKTAGKVMIDEIIPLSPNYREEVKKKFVDKKTDVRYSMPIDAGGNEAVLDNIGFGNEYSLNDDSFEIPYHEKRQLDEYVIRKNHSGGKLKKVDCKEIGNHFYIWKNYSKTDYDVVNMIEIDGNEDFINILRKDAQNGGFRTRESVRTAVAQYHGRSGSGNRSSVVDTQRRKASGNGSVVGGVRTDNGRGNLAESGGNKQTKRLTLPKSEYMLVSKAIMAKNAGKSEGDLKPVDFVYAADEFYVYENHAIGEFSVVRKYDVETEHDKIDDVKECVENGTYPDREKLDRFIDDVGSGKGSDSWNHGRVENGRYAMADDRVSGEEQRSNAIGYSSGTGADNGIKYAIYENERRANGFEIPYHEKRQLDEYVLRKNHSDGKLEEFDCKEIGNHFYIWENNSKTDYTVVNMIEIDGNEDLINERRMELKNGNLGIGEKHNVSHEGRGKNGRRSDHSLSAVYQRRSTANGNGGLSFGESGGDKVGYSGESGGNKQTRYALTSYDTDSESLTPERKKAIFEQWEKDRAGIAKPTKRQLWGERAEWVAHNVTRVFPNIPERGEKGTFFAEFRKHMIQWKNLPTTASFMVQDKLNKMTKGLTPEEFKTFSELVYFLDLQEEAKIQMEKGYTEILLPNEISPGEVDAVVKVLQEEASEKVRQALIKRQGIWEELKTRYMELNRNIGFDTDGKFKRKNYYHHQVIEYMNDGGKGTGGREIGIKAGRGWLKERQGSTKAINTDFLAVENKSMLQMQYDVYIAEMLGKIKQQYDIKPRLEKEAFEHNKKALNDIIQRECTDENGRVMLDKSGKPDSETYRKQKWYNARIMWGFDGLFDLAERGELNDFGGEYANVVEAFQKHELNADGLYKYVGIVASTTLPENATDAQEQAALHARSVLKYTSQKREWIKTTLADEYQTWETLAKSMRDTHTIHQPRRGNYFYTKTVIDEDAFNQAYNEMVLALASGEVDLGNADLNQLFTQYADTVRLTGAAYEQWVLPKEIVTTMDEIANPKQAKGGVMVARSIVSAWKGWATSVNPLRTVKFGLRNLFGDLDAVIAGNPKVTLCSKQAVQEIYQAMKHKKYSDDFMEWVKRGGYTSMIFANEMDSEMQDKLFSHLKEKQGVKIFEIPVKPFEKYYNGVENVHNFREAILRYSAYLYYKDEIKRNGGVVKDYVASNRYIVKGLNTVEDKAYQLSKDLLGAYDEVGKMGQTLRRYWVPFYSFTETNLKRYYRPFENIIASDDTIPKKAGKLLLKALMANMLTLLMIAWNKLVMKEIDDKLPPSVRNIPHLTLGRIGDDIYAFRQLGSFSELLEWVGLDDYKWTKEDLTAPVDKAWGMITPFVKLPVELASGLNFYPSLTQPRAIRDKWQHFFNSFGVDAVYNEVTGKPTRGVGEILKGAVTYNYDYKESAYYEILDIKREYQGKTDNTIYGTNAKSNALYYMKTAVRYKDKDAALKYLDEYFDNGGTAKGIKQSFATLNPMYGFTSKDTAEKGEAFIASLSEDEKEKLKIAQEYYENDLMLPESVLNALGEKGITDEKAKNVLRNYINAKCK